MSNLIRFLEDIGGNAAWHGGSRSFPEGLAARHGIPCEQQDAIFKGGEAALRGLLPARPVMRCLIVAPD